MSGYSAFAEYYDVLQRDVPYGRIAERIAALGRQYSSENEVIVELGCGTGRLCRELVKLGYDVIGVDISAEMLDIAEQYSEEGEVTYLLQDMTELDLWGAADIIVCVLDGMNHLKDEQAFCKAIERAAMFTCDGGLLIFDVNTEYKHRQILGDNAFVYDVEDEGLFCAWRNSCNEDGSVDIALDFFQNEGGIYHRSSEYFTEILISRRVIEDALGKSGFELVGVFDGLSEAEPCETTQRELYVCRRRPRRSVEQ